MDPALLDRLRDDLIAVDYRAGSVRALLGAEADDARLRGVFAPAARALAERGASPAGTLIRCFLLGEAVTGEELGAALPALGAAGAISLGLVRAGADPLGGVRAALALNPVAIAEDPRAPEGRDWWILSDLDDQLRRGPARPDHVMGVGGATRSLIALAPQGDSACSLDLGTGCGIVALHLALRGPVVATDISERALGFARANARLNAVDGIDFRLGDLFAPVAGERFELILSNPPFVVTPRRGGEGAGRETRYAYRDGGMIGDGLAARVVREAPDRLAEGGTLLCLANWESHWGVDGLSRVRGWIREAEERIGPPGSVAAWAIERDRVSPARYAETWARDGGSRPGEAAFEALVDDWLADFSARRVVALGLGSIRLRRLGERAGAPADADRLLRLERADGALSPGAGAHLASAFAAAIETAGMGDAEILEQRWVRSDDVVELREHRPGEDAPRAISLVSTAGIERRVSADPLLAAAVGACDGELSLAAIAGALATIFELDEPAVAGALVEGVRGLVWLGILAPVSR